ncbi:MAG TPA: hypothetical protein VF748_12205 [Candidatus Acidoferrum sp.]
MAQDPWPTVKRERIADFLTPDGYLRSERSVAGALRMGTEPRVGPRGLVAGGTASDFEMDRMPRRFDVMGSHNERTPPRPTSTLLSRAVRSRKVDNVDR